MMNRYWGICCAILCGLASARGAVVAGWDFTSAATGPLNNYAAPTTDPRATSVGLSTSGGLITPNASAGILNYSWTGHSSGGLNGAIITLQLTAAGATFSGFSVAYTAASDRVTAITGTWSYSINNGAFTGLAPEAIAVGTSATPNNDILAGINLVNNDLLRLRFTFGTPTVANNGSGDFDIDSLIVSASITPVPEPANVALGLFAVIALGVAVGRRVLKTRQA